MSERIADTEVREALRAFAAGTTVDDVREALRVLTLKKGVHAAAGTDQFEKGLRALLKAASRRESPRECLLAIATLSRISSTVKHLREPLEADLRDALHEPLPPLRFLTTPDDREYVAVACRLATGSWVATYLAQEAVLEEAAENARVELLHVLLTVAVTVSDGFLLLAESLARWTPETEAVRDSYGKRLRRLLAAICKVVAGTQCVVDRESGPNLARLLSVPLRSPGEATPEVKQQLAHEVCTLVHELIRRRFSLATYSRTYEPFAALKRWFLASQWVRFVNESADTRAVLEDVKEAIFLLATQGRTDNDLFKHLSLIAGSDSEARSLTRDIAGRDGIPPEVQSWLLSGEPPPPAKETSESATLAQVEQHTLALLLIDADRLVKSIETVRGEPLPRLEALRPEQGDSLTSMLNQGKALTDSIRAYATKAGLRLRSRAGELVEYSPICHDLSPQAHGTRWVRIMRPMVERVRPDGVTYVVVKALVEPEAQPTD